MENMCRNGILSFLVICIGFNKLCNVNAKEISVFALNTTTTTILGIRHGENSSTPSMPNVVKKITPITVTHDINVTTGLPFTARVFVTHKTVSSKATNINDTVRLSYGGKKLNRSYPKLFLKTAKTTPTSKRQTTENTNKKQKNAARQNSKESEKKPIDLSMFDPLNPFNIIEGIEKYVLPSMSGKINVTYEKLGRTAEYKDIVLMKMSEFKASFRTGSDRYVDEGPEKKIVFIVHGLSVMGITLVASLSNEYAFSQLLSFYTSQLDKFDIFLIPMANPDGFQKNFANIRGLGAHWNKNLSPQDECPGVALDRNFDVAWDSAHTISSCSQMYPGPNAFSEPETVAIRDVFHRFGHKIIAYLNVHSGTYNPRTFKGDAVLYPKGYSDSQADDDKYLDLKGLIEETIKEQGFRALNVNVDTLYNWYGKVTGTSVDYASTVYGIPYAMELVMQAYEEAPFEALLQKIWFPVLSVIFNYIDGNMNPVDGQ